MKKFLYFIAAILIIALVYAIWQFQVQTPDTTVTEETTQEATASTDNCICKSECICPEDDADCDCSQTKTICECTQENGEVTTIESVETNNVDIEETNPDETAGEDETADEGE